MAATVSIQTEDFNTKRQTELLKMLNDKEVQKQANLILKRFIDPFVPKKSGMLRRSAVVTHKSITWGRRLPYGHYQFEGQIYGKNYPIIRGGKIVGWYSKPEVTKSPTGRMMEPYSHTNPELMGWKFGYYTPGTQHHWTQEIDDNQERWKAEAGRQITRFLKEECKKRGLRV